MLWTLLSVVMQAGIALASVTIMVALALAGLALRLTLALCGVLWRTWGARQVTITPPAAVASPATAPKSTARSSMPRPRPYQY